MLAQITTLRHWKSEHSAETCEDAAEGNNADGLFAVADGAGTTLFSEAWAHFLVRHFLTVPLLSADPFEAEWWVRMAQEQFRQESPTYTDLAWNAQQKVQSQGSYATLATVRISAQNATHAQAELLVIGDSCVFINRPATRQTSSFPLQQAAEFEQAPICIPSKAGAFNRYFHRFQRRSLPLTPEDVVVIATDAVAKWIVSAGNGRYDDQSTALQEILSQTSDSWPAFIQACRSQQEMIDDDCTALIIMLQADDVADTTLPPRLGTTTEHSQPIRKQRKQEFLQALADHNKERAAIYYGDGRDLQDEEINFSLQDAVQARLVADAQREVLAHLRQEIHNPNVVAIMTDIWQKHAQRLYQEPCSATIRTTLARLGVPIEPYTTIEPATPLQQETKIQEPGVAAIPEQQADSEGDEEHNIEMLQTQIFEIQLPTQQQTEDA